MHIDPLTAPFTSAIGLVGLVWLLWPARKPKPDPKPELGEPWNHARVAKPTEEELRSRGIDPEEFFKGALTKPVYPGPASEVIDLGASAHEFGTSAKAGLPFLTREQFASEYETQFEDRAAPDPSDALRFFVSTKKGRGNRFWKVRDRANFRETPAVYTRRSSALRAARRLNAKAELDARTEASSTTDLPPYDPKWGAHYQTRFQVMPYPIFPEIGEAQRFLVIDTDLSKVRSGHDTDADAAKIARVLNGTPA